MINRNKCVIMAIFSGGACDTQRGGNSNDGSLSEVPICHTTGSIEFPSQRLEGRAVMSKVSSVSCGGERTSQRGTEK
jgi:hypothetical protein